MAENAPTYNVAAIRRLLILAFTPEDLKRFCQDTPILAPIIPRFGTQHGLDDMAGEVIDYCQTHYIWDELLAAVKLESPRQYARMEPELYLSADEAAAFPRPRPWSWDPRTWRPWAQIGAPLGIVIVALVTWWALSADPDPDRGLNLMPTSSSGVTPSPIPTATRLPEPYHAAWRSVGGEAGFLGMPIATPVSRRYSVQEFEHGLMFYRYNKFEPPENWIYVIYWGPGDDKSAGSSWVRVTETWLAGDPPLSCDEAAPLPLGPAAGFGRVWCDDPDVRTRLGAALDQEANVKGGWFDFAHGVMLYDIWNKRVFALFDNQHWRAFAD